MADLIDRIIVPVAVAPDRVSGELRERGKKEREGAPGRDREPRAAAPAQPAEEDAPKDQLKGNRLNIVA